MILGTAGHIDHGKTTLVKALTGVDTDRLPEEKKRGITIDLGFAPLAIEGNGTIGVVDVPGHEAFVRTMLAGASGIDLALLVIAADEGVMPQTREHLEILSLLGLQQAVVALTKCDLVDAEWLGLVSSDIAELLAATPLAGAEICPVSALTGTGIDELRSSIARAAFRVGARSEATDLFRMPVDRAFTMKGTGTVVTGTIWSGSVGRDEFVSLFPGGRQLRVRAVQRHGAAVGAAAAGERAAIALAGCEVDEIGRGSVLVSGKDWIPTNAMDAVVTLFSDVQPITARTRLRFHLGTTEVSARIVSRPATRGASRNDDVYRVVLTEPIVARGGDRFVLRYPSPPRTIGGGTVIDPYPPGRKHRDDTGSESQSKLENESADPRSRLARIMQSSGTRGVRLATLAVRTGLLHSDVDASLASLEAVCLGEWAYSRRALSDLELSVEAAVREHAANFPLEPGVSIQTMRARVKSRPEVVDWTLDRLKKRGRLDLDGGIARPSGGAAALGTADQALSDAIVDEISTKGSEPPA
ncbi:MAG: selenocysteine-specific translation elongation factor, partial [Gemmatimonadota bacterium]|nr:selenocysteine-specific translation elongation factor [Gemmatimonadota bacterium]